MNRNKQMIIRSTRKFTSLHDFNVHVVSIHHRHLTKKESKNKQTNKQKTNIYNGGSDTLTGKKRVLYMYFFTCKEYHDSDKDDGGQGEALDGLLDASVHVDKNNKQ